MSGHSIEAAPKPFYKLLYVQVLFAIVLGGLVGAYFPAFATNDWIKAMGDGFIKLIKMVIAPIIFFTVVSGIAHIQDAKKVGRVGLKALIYFENPVFNAGCQIFLIALNHADIAA
jgi:aerobic C4-dicarboxylate transport protein